MQEGFIPSIRTELVEKTSSRLDEVFSGGPSRTQNKARCARRTCERMKFVQIFQLLFALTQASRNHDRHKRKQHPQGVLLPFGGLTRELSEPPISSDN